MKSYKVCPDRWRPWLVLLSWCLLSCQSQFEQIPLQVGFAVGDITPNRTQIASGKIYLGAYGAPYSRSATGVHDPIYARAMAVDCGPRQLLLVACDLPGIGHNSIAEIKRRVTDATQVDPDYIGPLSNSLQVRTLEGAVGEASVLVQVKRFAFTAYLPLVLRE